MHNPNVGCYNLFALTTYYMGADRFHRDRQLSVTAAALCPVAAPTTPLSAPFLPPLPVPLWALWMDMIEFRDKDGKLVACSWHAQCGAPLRRPPWQRETHPSFVTGGSFCGPPTGGLLRCSLQRWLYRCAPRVVAHSRCGPNGLGERLWRSGAAEANGQHPEQLTLLRCAWQAASGAPDVTCAPPSTPTLGSGAAYQQSPAASTRQTLRSESATSLTTTSHFYPAATSVSCAQASPHSDCPRTRVRRGRQGRERFPDLREAEAHGEGWANFHRPPLVSTEADSQWMSTTAIEEPVMSDCTE